jgi:hypothetical protein
LARSSVTSAAGPKQPGKPPGGPALGHALGGLLAVFLISAILLGWAAGCSK